MDALDRGRSAFAAQAWSDAVGALAEVKRRWDPDNLFRANRNVAPAG